MARYMTKSEAMRKRAWFRALSGLADFFASIGSVIIILLCVALLTQLFVWLRNDITQTLYSIESVAISAIVQPDAMKEPTDIVPAAAPVPAMPINMDDVVIVDDEDAEGESEGEDEASEGDESEEEDASEEEDMPEEEAPDTDEDYEDQDEYQYEYEDDESEIIS